MPFDAMFAVAPRGKLPVAPYASRLAGRMHSAVQTIDSAAVQAQYCAVGAREYLNKNPDRPRDAPTGRRRPAWQHICATSWTAFGNHRAPARARPYGR